MSHPESCRVISARIYPHRLHLRYPRQVSLILNISVWVWVGGFPRLAAGPDLEARWTDDFSGLWPDSLGRWLPLFPISPGTVPVRPVPASPSIRSVFSRAPVLPAYHLLPTEILTVPVSPVRNVRNVRMTPKSMAYVLSYT